MRINGRSSERALAHIQQKSILQLISWELLIFSREELKAVMCSYFSHLWLVAVPIYHHFICTGIGRIDSSIHVIDLFCDEAEKVMLQWRFVRFEEIKATNREVFRYLPLYRPDCRPGDETLQ